MNGWKQKAQTIKFLMVVLFLNQENFLDTEISTKLSHNFLFIFKKNIFMVFHSKLSQAKDFFLNIFLTFIARKEQFSVIVYYSSLFMVKTLKYIFQVKIYLGLLMVSGKNQDILNYQILQYQLIMLVKQSLVLLLVLRLLWKIM